MNPTIDWGPALVEHRRLVDYVDGWVIDPNNPTDMQLGSYSVRTVPKFFHCPGSPAKTENL